MYIRDANIIIIVYDISSKSSFEHVKNWLKDVNDIKKDKSLIAFIGNKIDLPDKEVLHDDMEKLTNETNSLNLTLSAKTGDGVDLFFSELFNKMSDFFGLHDEDGGNDAIGNTNMNKGNVTEKFDLSNLKNTKIKKRKCCGKS